MIRKLLMGLLAPIALATPALATIQPGTGPLLQRVSEDYTVDINPKECNVRNIDGSFRPHENLIVICTDPSGWDANDHDTVRHEVWHVIQHCTRLPGEYTLQPVIRTNPEWQNYVMSRLSTERYSWILENYPSDHWKAEMEAFVMAEYLTSSQIEQLYVKACQ